MANNVLETNQKTAYDELLVSSPLPRVQVSAVYGVLDGILTVTDVAASGSISAENSQFTVSTGIAADGLATALTKEQMSAKTGVGGLVRLDAKFSPGVANNSQRAGPQNSQDAAVFAYVGVDFGILYYHNGRNENQQLNVTTGAQGIETAQVGVDGIIYNVDLTPNVTNTLGQSDEIHTATEIAESLKLQIPIYQFSANETDGVVFVDSQSILAGPQGAFSFTSATAVATWSQDVAGVDPISTFIPASDWTGEFDHTNLDPTKINYYQIRFDGNLEFSIYNPDESRYEVAHVISNANNSEMPLFGNPAFRAGWVVQNTGNTTDVTLSGQGAALLEEGLSPAPVNPLTISVENLSVGITPTNLASIRNRFHFNEKYNRADILLKVLEISTETAKIGFFDLYLNPVFSEDMVYSYSSFDASTAEISLTPAFIVGGTLLGRFICKATNPRAILPGDINIKIIPGDVICTAVSVSQVPAAQMYASAFAIEDL